MKQKQNPIRRGRGFRPAMFAAMMIAAMFATGAAPAADAAEQLPAPTGPHAVGRRLMAITDDGREEPWTADPNDKRALLLLAYYPAVPGTGKEETPFVPAFEGEKPMGLAMSVSRGKLYKPHARGEAEPEGKGWPVAIFSTGAGTSPAFYSFIAEDLASHGWFVFVVDHAYENAGQVYPDGRKADPIIEKFRPQPPAWMTSGPPRRREDLNDEEKKQAEEFEKKRAEHEWKWIGVRADDMRTAADVIGMQSKMDLGPFYKRTDPKRIVAIGHSVGGKAAGEAARRDARFIAAVNLDGLTRSLPIVPSPEGKILSQPFLFLGKEWPAPTEEQLARMKMTAEQAKERDEKELGMQGAQLATIAGGGWRILISNATHGDFSDETYMPGKGKYTDRAQRDRVTALTRATLRAWLDQVISGKPSALLEKPPAEWQGVRVEKFGR